MLCKCFQLIILVALFLSGDSGKFKIYAADFFPVSSAQLEVFIGDPGLKGQRHTCQWHLYMTSPVLRMTTVQGPISVPSNTLRMGEDMSCFLTLQDFHSHEMFYFYFFELGIILQFFWPLFPTPTFKQYCTMVMVATDAIETRQALKMLIQMTLLSDQKRCALKSVKNVSVCLFVFSFAILLQLGPEWRCSYRNVWQNVKVSVLVLQLEDPRKLDRVKNTEEKGEQESKFIKLYMNS